MKTLLASMIIIVAVTTAAFPQNINWRSLGEDQQNIIRFNFGYDGGVAAQAGYYRTFTLIRPVATGIDVSVPMGNNLLDDYKVRLGVQVELLEIDGFSATFRLNSAFRRYESELVKISSFGADYAVVAGYYSPTWSVGGEFGLDKAITSRLMHTDRMKESFPGIKDGWYVPTGGHWFYGIHGTKTLGETLDLSLKAGATMAQRNDENAAVPLYLQLGFGVRF
jgi:hypothetical protein